MPRLVVLLALLLPTIARADFERDVAPLLVRRCLECHSGGEPSGKLDLTTEAGFRKGGRTGATADVLPAILDDGRMPPPKQGKPQRLPDAETALLRQWLKDGAKWPAERTLDLYERTTPTRAGRDWWSLQPVRSPAPPVVRGDCRNPIDAFLLAPLEARGWQPAPEADRRSLLRRLSFDLIGLPPTIEEVEAFERDVRPDAYERQVERLLASPHHGERMARGWLDLVRFADTSGYERDQVKPFAWKYRDWVVRSFNNDKPYAAFLTEQLAGDEFIEPTEDGLIATGFLRLGTWNDEPNDPREYLYDRLEDLVGATTTAFLGLTVKCARCHDHKFDPIPQRDYYRMAAAFWPGPIEPAARDLLGGPDPKLLPLREVLAWTDLTARPKPIHLLRKGDPTRPGAEVAFGFLSAIPKLDREPLAPGSASRTSQRRLQLARWLVDPAHPLTARVRVNRLWQHHFGDGLVRNPDNFGFTGDRPTHPELLDWLASRFIADGWSEKSLHRLMVTSRFYRQSSLHPQAEVYSRVDAANDLRWHFPRRRLDADGLRDALLFAGGRLDRNLGGPSFYPSISADALEGLSMKSAAYRASPPEQQRRRSLYTFLKRGLLPPLLTTFDAPDTTLPCGKRDITTVAPQALTLLNNAFTHEQSTALARRVAPGATADETIRQVWRLALARDPRPSELLAAREHLTRQRGRFATDGDFLALASLCHVLLNTNEFAILD